MVVLDQCMYKCKLLTSHCCVVKELYWYCMIFRFLITKREMAIEEWAGTLKQDLGTSNLSLLNHSDLSDPQVTL